MSLSSTAQRVDALMKARQLNRKSLALATGIPYSRLYEWFRRDNGKPNGEDAATLAAFFNVPVGHIMHGDPLPENDSRGLLTEVYDHLDPSRRSALERYARFLLEEQKAGHTEEGD